MTMDNRLTREECLAVADRAAGGLFPYSQQLSAEVLTLRATLSALFAERDRLRELLAADRYYDDAQFGWARAKYNGENITKLAEDVAEAAIRRAAAIIALTPDPSP